MLAAWLVVLPSASAAPTEVSLGVALAYGRESWPGKVLAAADLLPVELRFGEPRATGGTSTFDLQVDWEELVYSAWLSSSPRVGIVGLYHPQVPLGGHWAAVFAPGIDLDWGRNAVVRDGELRWVSAGSFGLAGRVGFDWDGRRRHSWGLYARGTFGFRAAVDGPEDWIRGLLEVSSVWRLGREEEE